MNAGSSSKVPIKLPAAIWVLGLVSFFTDLSSEMIYPLLPLFLTSVLGAGAVALGVIEGAASATVAIMKLVSGYWTDRIGKRKPFVLAGYSLAGAVRPLIAFAASWPAVLVLRILDRVGKGLRSPPRDALIADITPATMRGRAFGLHRAMDHGGAVAGPLLAALLLHQAGWPLRWVFLAAAVPALLVVILILVKVQEPPVSQSGPIPIPKTDSSLGHWREFGPRFHWFLVALAIFTLGNATDAFILLAFTEAGLAVHWVAVLWAVHHLIKMGSSYLAGAWSDRVGRRRVILGGWFLYAAVYFGFALSDRPIQQIAVFLIYGLTFGLTEPTEKALVADMAPAGLRGTAFGWYQAVCGLVALPASVLFGWVWFQFGREFAFAMGSGLALVAAILFAVRVRS